MGQTYAKIDCPCGGRSSGAGFAKAAHEQGNRHLEWLREHGTAPQVARLESARAARKSRAAYNRAVRGGRRARR